MVKEPNQKPQNLPHEGNDEYKIKERRNHCKQKPKKKKPKKKLKRKGNIKRSVKETRKSMFHKRDLIHTILWSTY